MQITSQVSSEQQTVTHGLRIEPETVLRVTQDQVSCEIGEEAVLLQLQRGQYFGLNAIGTQVWKILQKGPTSMAQLQNWMIEKYDVQPDECARDLEALLCSMIDAGLIEIAR